MAMLTRPELSTGGGVIQVDDFYRTMIEAAAGAHGPQNSQPWHFHVGDDRVYAGLDMNRLLHVADPQKRIAWVSLGAAVENARLTALAGGANPVITFTGHPDWPVEISFAAEAAKPTSDTNLAGWIPRLSQYRGPFTTPAISPAEYTAAGRAGLPSAALTKLEANARHEFADFAEAAVSEALADADCRQDLQRWMRLRGENAKRPIDGITLDAMGLSGVKKLAAPYALMPPLNRVAGFPGRSGREAREMALAAPDIFLVTCDTEDARGWFEGGRGMQRVLLALCGSGIATFAPVPLLAGDWQVDELRRLFTRPRGGIVAVVRAGRPAIDPARLPLRPAEDFLA